mgnify:CR=1 FL=1
MLKLMAQYFISARASVGRACLSTRGSLIELGGLRKRLSPSKSFTP